MKDELYSDAENICIKKFAMYQNYNQQIKLPQFTTLKEKVDVIFYSGITKIVGELKNQDQKTYFQHGIEIEKYNSIIEESKKSNSKPYYFVFLPDSQILIVDLLKLKSLGLQIKTWNCNISSVELYKGKIKKDFYLIKPGSYTKEKIKDDR